MQTLCQNYGNIGKSFSSQLIAESIERKNVAAPTTLEYINKRFLYLFAIQLARAYFVQHGA